MDTAEITHLSLCSGYGGIDLGLKRVLPNLRTVAYAEIEAFAIECLLARMEGGQLDAAPIWSDLKSFPWDSFHGMVDLLSGGYPCQPFSSAGKRAGADDPRHLWPFISAGIAAMRPSLCFFENVEGHISLGLPDVIEDLAGMGYRTTWGIFSAAEVGAPHQRKRVFILAHCNGERGQLSDWRQLATEQVPISNGTARRDVWPSRPGQPQHAWEPPRVVGNTESREDNGRESRDMGGATGKRGRSNDAADCAGEGVGNTESGDGQWSAQWEARYAAQPDQGLGESTRELPHGSGTGSGEAGCSELADSSEWEVEPTLGGDADGTSDRLDYAQLCVTCDNRTDELRLLGNGVVPATAALAFRTLLQELTQ